jgi:hypothetical protein
MPRYTVTGWDPNIPEKQKEQAFDGLTLDYLLAIIRNLWRNGLTSVSVRNDDGLNVAFYAEKTPNVLGNLTISPPTWGAENERSGIHPLIEALQQHLIDKGVSHHQDEVVARACIAARQSLPILAMEMTEHIYADTVRTWFRKNNPAAPNQVEITTILLTFPALLDGEALDVVPKTSLRAAFKCMRADAERYRSAVGDVKSAIKDLP